MQEAKRRMLDEQNSSNTSDWSSYSFNLEYENLNNIYPERIYLAATDKEMQSCLKEVTAIQERCGFEMLKNIQVLNTDRNEVVKQQKCTPNKISTRTVPNILKNNLKSHRASQVAPTETDIVHNRAETSIQFLIDSTVVPGSSLLKNESIKKQSKRNRLSHRRKQEHNYTGIWQDLPNWNMYSLINEENEASNTSLYTLPDLESSKQGKKLKRHVKKRNEKHKMSVLRSEQNEDSLPPIPCDLSVDFPSEFHTFPSPQETEPKDSQDPIDFTSNEIFSKYNYECQGTSKLDCFAECIMVSDETRSALSIIHENDGHGKGYDMNGNEIDVQKPARCSSMRNEQNEEDSLTSHTFISSEYWSEDVQFPCNKNPNCSSDLCCGYCQEDCVSNWITTSGAQNINFTKNKVLAETLNENLINECSNTDHQIHFRRSDLHVTWSDEHSTDDILKEENADNNSITIGSGVYPQCAFENNTELPLFDLTPTYNEDGVGKDIFEESTSTVEGREYNGNDISLLESDPDLFLYISEEEMESACIIDTSQAETNKQYNTNNEEFQCLLCPLTFSSARTMAMHQAGAHGGMYVILCESCGRLFNRKYHFNRHFIHCGRLKEPYKCDMCMRTYRHKSSLVQHLKISHHVHYTRNRSTTFVCSVCKKIYSKFGAFENHVKRHKNEW
ncbi:uncharacterized protein LOC143371111 isoform X3 [Andrena cerasifolii]|uniref:uncharacterized protein LOC143371111 isoform X3 n=1 Tax=Andrena cerasifolii TaxID=2819439 RepID=UPI004037B9E8